MPCRLRRRTHRRRRFTGRDPDEAHRAATPLELLYDLTFVVAFGAAADELAHTWRRATGAGVVGFGFAVRRLLGVVNYSWFASAYDTDDWVFRLVTMVQMIGVLVLALGLPPMFASIERRHLDNGVMVAGYVIMRVRSCSSGASPRRGPSARGAARTYIATSRRPGRLDRAAVAVHGRGDVPCCSRVLIVARAAGPCVAERRAHAVAPAPHRGALRPAGDHHAG